MSFYEVWKSGSGTPIFGQTLLKYYTATRRGGVISIPGVYAGYVHAFLIGDAFDKGLTFRMGQTHVQRLLPELLDHIENGDLQPEAIITHRLPLHEAARTSTFLHCRRSRCNSSKASR